MDASKFVSVPVSQGCTPASLIRGVTSPRPPRPTYPCGRPGPRARRPHLGPEAGPGARRGIGQTPGLRSLPLPRPEGPRPDLLRPEAPPLPPRAAPLPGGPGGAAQCPMSPGCLHPRGQGAWRGNRGRARTAGPGAPRPHRDVALVWNPCSPGSRHRLRAPCPARAPAGRSVPGPEAGTRGTGQGRHPRPRPRQAQGPRLLVTPSDPGGLAP